ncbi:MAG: N-acetylneuraminate synthase family protein, partial [Candidatus Odinarchaeota archaeon]
TLKKVFNFPIGFSDHTLGIHISLAAVAMGAKVIERHITLDRNQEGPDHHFSLEPSELKKLVIGIREIEMAMGDGIKKPHKLELKENYEKGRRSIIAAKDIPKGTIITRKMLIIKRPGYGIKPKFINFVIGRKSKKDIEYDQWITWDMV